ncbi:MAG: glycosyltransferase family 4 protein [Planctomycetes bacterium]|nr:glycosyltransferase family 4 protein [Planctomycetota bacterium]
MPGEKVRVVHYCNQLGIGGTERTMELFCQYLDRERFEVFVVSRRGRTSLSRKLKVELRALFGSEAAAAKRRQLRARDVRVERFRAVVGADNVRFARDDADLRRVLLDLSPDVLHVHYSGDPEPPTSDEAVMSRVPVTVTTNQFERHNTAPAHRHVRKMLFVSKGMFEAGATWAHGDPRADVLHNPVEAPCDQGDLRAELGLPPDAFVLGRVGRADPAIFDPISLLAYREVQGPRTWFLALSPPENMVREAARLGLVNFVALPPTVDQRWLSRFYNTIDVLAHARKDGETFGCNIAEAMVHGKPVVSHISAVMNGHVEVIGDTGFVAPLDDWRAYAARLAELQADPAARRALGERARARALERFEARALTRRLEGLYLELLARHRPALADRPA